MVSSLRAPFAYEGAARTAILTLKFRSGRYLAPLMGTFLREELDIRPLHVDVVVPVPLAPGRLRQRGFNQAALLAEQVALHAAGTLLDGALTRRERPPQSSLRLTDRLSNLAGAFTCPRREQLEGKRVLLVDDVVTTGTTVSVCADTLAEAGARRISVLAFARDL
jgi:ComF family protein